MEVVVGQTHGFVFGKGWGIKQNRLEDFEEESTSWNLSKSLLFFDDLGILVNLGKSQISLVNL